MKMKDLSTKEWVVITCIVLAFVTYRSFSSDEPEPTVVATPEPEKPKIELGQNIALHGDVIGGATKDDLDQVFKVMQMDDRHGYAQMLMEGRAIPLQKGQLVKYIDWGISTAEVRVLDGDFEGKSCYIPVEYLSGDFK